MNNPGIESGIVLFLVCGMIMWPVMTCCVDYFMVISYATAGVGITYATTGLKDHVVIT